MSGKHRSRSKSDPDKKPDKKPNKKPNKEPVIIPDVESWSEKSVLKCKTIGDRAGAFVWLLNKTAEYYESIDFNIGIGLIVAAYLLGAGGMPTLIANVEPSIVRIINGIIQGLMVVLGTAKVAIIAFGFNKRISKHRWASAAFSGLFVDIQKTLGQPVEKRESFHTFYQRIQEKEFSLKRKTPYIPPRVIKQYYITLKAKALATEILFGDVQEIDVYIESGKEFLANKPLTNADITNMMTRSKSLRHKTYEEDFAISKRNLKLDEVVIKDDALESSHGDLTKAKKVSEMRRYALERYFIGDEL
jgi:hypothetical protein